MEKISSQDLSVVVQGPNIKKHTYKCLKSLRKNFPEAQIIFSTYKKENTDNLDFDVLVKSNDPKATKLSETMSNNINRILVTTKAGLNKVTRKYCLKIRSDMFFENDKILLNLGIIFESSFLRKKYPYMAVGDKAVKLKIDSAIGLNEFYTDRDGNETLVSAKGNEGGFVHVVDSLDEDEKNRNTFMCDMVITGAIRKEADEEKQIPEKVIVKGAIFDFRNAVLPVEFSAVNPAAMNYFEGMGATPQTPKFTKIWGNQVSEQIVRTITEESAFGNAQVREIKSSRKDFVITGAAKEEYVWDSEETILASELAKAMTDRELHLAELKKRWLESKTAEPATTTTQAGATIGGFKF